MAERKEINIDDYAYTLPENRIAKFPVQQRDHSKLLVYQNGDIHEDMFKNIPRWIGNNSLLVFNNSKVINARLTFKKNTGATIEIFCLEPVEPNEYESNLKQNRQVAWKCLVGNRKKWKKGHLELNTVIDHENVTIKAIILETGMEHVTIEFSWNNSNINFSSILENAGNVPIPPYLRRATVDLDKNRYQTVYSSIEGSVAAPTAGLHFTNDVLRNIIDTGNACLYLTLHVSAGTFRPVQSTTIRQHKMHEEMIILNKNTINELKNSNKRIISVGTTSARTLESIYWLGVKTLDNPCLSLTELNLSQWENEKLRQHVHKKEAFSSLVNYMNKMKIDNYPVLTGIIIVPGYEFRMVDGLVTNFHMPKSTLLLLIAAFVGDDWKKIYQYAINNDFRFLSYGDSSFLIKGNGSLENPDRVKK